jgi:hypothetical protein
MGPRARARALMRPGTARALPRDATGGVRGRDNAGVACVRLAPSRRPGQCAGGPGRRCGSGGGGSTSH